MSDLATAADYMTVLTTFGPLATKTVGWDATTGQPAIIASYGDAATFGAARAPVRTLDEMHMRLQQLTGRQRSFAIRAELLPNVDPRRCRRLLHPMREADGTVTAATFREVPRRWLACDFDSVACPASFDWINDPRGTVKHLLRLLPGEFAHPVPKGARPEDGFTMCVHPVFMTQLQRVPYLALGL